ncbi:hypothetical protein AHF37_03907 [Paragonimus kellicotti]|nr:hypothetical protein AHF37_03907 [Paragonimus kellicotti]
MLIATFNTHPCNTFILSAVHATKEDGWPPNVRSETEVAGGSETIENPRSTPEQLEVQILHFLPAKKR